VSRDCRHLSAGADAVAAVAALAASVAVDSVLAASRAAAAGATAGLITRPTDPTVTSSAAWPRCCSSLSSHNADAHTRTLLTLYGHIVIQLYVIGTLAVDGWAVTFGTARTGLGGLGPRPVLSLLYQM